MFGVTMDKLVSGGGGVNIYNYREFGTYDFSDVIGYLNDTATKTMYHVPSMINYSDVNTTVYAHMGNDFMQS